MRGATTRGTTGKPFTASSPGLGLGVFCGPAVRALLGLAEGADPHQQPVRKGPRDVHLRSTRSPLCLGRGSRGVGAPSTDLGGEAVRPGVLTSGPSTAWGPSDSCWPRRPRVGWLPEPPPRSEDLFPACSGKEPREPQTASFDVPPSAGPGATGTRVIRVNTFQAFVTRQAPWEGPVTCLAFPAHLSLGDTGIGLLCTDEEAEHESVPGLSSLLGSNGRRGVGACGLAGAGENWGSMCPL